MLHLKKIPVLIFTILITLPVAAQQTRLSLASDLTILRSFGKDQRFWAIGQTVVMHLHLSPRDGAYAWLSYYTNGKFSNQLQATAKDPATMPQSINFVNQAEMRLKHISIGWRHFLLGNFNTERGLNVYHYAGFGLMIGRIANTHSVPIDTGTYNMPVFSGTANFKRLTLDLGLGVEKAVGGDVYIYLEGRALIPTTDYPSQHIFRNENAPFTGAVNTGLRILF